jgi:hypothetical protein
MKNITQLFMVLFILILASSAVAQEEQEEMSPEMRAWMEYMTPGWAHEMMSEAVGSWKTETTFWQYPGAAPEKSTGEAKSEMIMGGRYLRSYHTGNAMGMPMEGLSLTAYDNVLKKFKNIWIDNMGTGISMSTGTYDKETQTTEYEGTMVDPVTGKDVKYKALDRKISNDKSVFEMHMEFQGEMFKSMEISFTRK